VASVLLASGRLEYNAYREDAAEASTRRMLDLVGAGGPDPATRMLRALGERSLGDIRLRQGRATEALTLMESAKRALVDLQSSRYTDASLGAEIAVTQERLARARIFTGDLDGALTDFLELLQSTAACDGQAPAGPSCRALGVRLSWTADVYGALDRPNLNQPAKAATLYEQALHIQERLAALDDHDRQARFDLAARCGKLGDAVWSADPERALSLYERALTTAKTLASKEQLEILRNSYLIAISRPLIKLGRIVEARKVLTEALALGKADAQSPYADRIGDIAVREIWPTLLLAEGKLAEAQRALVDLIRDTHALRAANPHDLTPIYFLSESYRLLASITTGSERRDALRHSAAAWHSWPATTFTAREEQKDLAAADR